MVMITDHIIMVHLVDVIVVEESFIWIGFKRPSTYLGWKRDENGSTRKYKQDSDIRMVIP